MCEASDIFDGVAPVAGGFFGEPPAFVVANSVRVPNGWVTNSPGSCRNIDYPAGASSNNCWTANSFQCSLPASKIYPAFHIHGLDDREEPVDLVVAQYRFMAEELMGCAASSEQQYMTKGNAVCTKYTECANGNQPALCTISGLGHNM
jgi:poly(3-hydroxybutyrate) depolymerase